MDYTTILYIVVIIFGVILLAIIGKILREKNIVKAEDLVFAMRILQISVDIVDELNLKDEAKIKNIAEIVITSIDYVVNSMDEETEKTDLAKSYAYQLCEKAGIKLTDERKRIIDELIVLTMPKK